MDVRLPDGTTIKNVPDGTTKADLVARLQRNGMTVPAEWLQAGEVAQAQLALPAEDPGLLQTILIGSGRSFDRMGKGMQQLYYGATKQQGKLDELKAAAAEDDRLYKPLQELRPFATGVGEALPSMVIPGGGATTLLGNAGRMALAGAIPGALEYGDAGERAKRAGIGAAAGAAIPLGVAALKTAKSFAEPLYAAGREAIAGRTLNRVVGDQAGAVSQRLRAASELVPGSMPTAAQVGDSGGLAALERSAAASNPEPYAYRAAEQASARLNALRSVAKDEATLQAANDARAAATKPLYDAADMGVAPVDGVFKGLMMRPQFKSATQRAQELAKNDGLDEIFFRGANGEPLALIGQGAHYIKKALDEAAEYGSASYTSKHSAISAGKTNDAFQQWLGKSIPEYGQARDAFQRLSKPVNQMKVGQALLEKAKPALSDYGAIGKESAASYAKALRDGDAVAANVTGFGGAKLSSVMDPGQMATLEAIARDLARKSNAQDLGRGVGSDTFQKLAMQNIAEQSGMPRMVGGLLQWPGINRATNWAYRDTDAQVQGLLADVLLDPKKSAALMDKAGKKALQNNPELRQLLEQTAIRGGGLLAAGQFARD